MSRTSEDWGRAKQRAIDIRVKLREALDLLDDWEPGFSDVAEEALYELEYLMKNAEHASNQVIGATTIHWD